VQLSTLDHPHFCDHLQSEWHAGHGQKRHRAPAQDWITAYYSVAVEIERRRREADQAMRQQPVNLADGDEVQISAGPPRLRLGAKNPINEVIPTKDVP